MLFQWLYRDGVLGTEDIKVSLRCGLKQQVDQIIKGVELVLVEEVFYSSLWWSLCGWDIDGLWKAS